MAPLGTLVFAVTAAFGGPSDDPAPSGVVLYTRLTAQTWQVWRRELLTGEDEQLTFDLGDKRYPRWTDAGDVYYHTVNQGAYVLRSSADGVTLEPVLRDVWPVRDLAWSGSRVAFSRIRTDVIDAANLCVRDERGSVRWITQDPGIQYNPSWSPDGSRIAFVSGNGWGSYEIETIAADGSDRRRLTENRFHEFLPAWSPDGARIAFVSDRGGNYDVWVMDADGGDVRQITRHPGLDTGPSWSPDGRWIAYTSARSGVLEIWATPAAGGEARPLVQVPGGARDPAWGADRLSRAELAATLPAHTVSEVSARPKTLVARAEGGVEIRFRLDRDASVVVDIVDEGGHVCRRLDRGAVRAGVHSARWDGRDDDGVAVADGVYRYAIAVRDADGRTIVHDPSVEPWGEGIDPVDFTHDPEAGVLRWIQPQAGFVRMRTAVQGFPLLGTLLDWAPMEAGERTLEWHGYDDSGRIHLAAHPDRWITLESYSLPRNAILVSHGVAGRPLRDAPDRPAPYRALVGHGDDAHLEARKSRWDSLVPRLRMEFPDAGELDAKGHPLLRGTVPVRVSIAPEDAASMTDALFEVAFYVDLQFVFEDEESTTPMTWLWDTSTLPPGQHLLTVNVFSYDGRIGSLTRPVTIAPAR